MELTLQRMYDNGKETIGLLTEKIGNGALLLCFTLEDQHRDVKVHGDTRIPAGRYALKLRKIGTKHEEYAEKFPNMHKGMLEITGIPNFEAVMLHIGNTEADTAGCPLVGCGVTLKSGRLTLDESTIAYKKIYPAIAATLLAGRPVWITVKDECK